MSFLATLFSQSRFERKQRISGSRRGSQDRSECLVSRYVLRPGSLQSKKNFHLDTLSACENLEPRIALSVNTIISENLAEEDYSGAPRQQQPGQVIIASDMGSDVFIQQLQTTPTQLLVSDNGSFLADDSRVIIENVNAAYEEVFVTNGTLQRSNTSAEEIIADSWWLFPSEEDASQYRETRLALDRPFIEVGDTGGGVRDLYGTIKYRQADGEISEWTFSSWRGTGNDNEDFVLPPGDNTLGDPLFVTGGPGFGGRAESFENPIPTDIKERKTGYVFPRLVRLETVGDTYERRVYLKVEWSQTPTEPPIISADYRGFRREQTTATSFTEQDRRDYAAPLLNGATVGIAANSRSLRFQLKDAIVSGSDDQARSLGIVPGTLSGRIEVGADGQELVYSTTFVDRRNVDVEEQQWEPDVGGPEHSLYFQNIGDVSSNNDSENFYRYGRLLRKSGPDAYQDIDHAYERSERSNQDQNEWGNDLTGSNEPLGIAGGVVDQSTVKFELASYRTRDLGYRVGTQTPLEGFNVVFNGDDTAIKNLLKQEKARSAVRLKDLQYLVFVKPTVPNDVVFADGADITRNVTVDLLSEGSSVFVNSPIDVENSTGDIDFRATNVYINAPAETDSYFLIGRSESTQNARLPRTTSPEGGTQISPTFGQIISDDVQSQLVEPNAVIGNNSGGITELVVLPGNEGFGYDSANPPELRYELVQETTAEVEILSVVGGVSELILGETGSGYSNSSDDVIVTFEQPQLRRVDRFDSWPDSPLAEGFTASPLIAISQPEVVLSPNRIGSGERAQAKAYVGDGIRYELEGGGKNYSVPPTVKLELTDKAKEEWGETSLFDPTFEADPELLPLLTMPVLTADVTVYVEVTTPTTPGAFPTYKYVSGSVTSLNVKSAGFGLNYSNLDDVNKGGNADGKVSVDELKNRFKITLTGGTKNPPTGINYIDKTTTPSTSGTTGTAAKSTFTNWPTAVTTPATIEISAPLQGTLRWQNDNSGPLSLANQGSNYELSPTLQFVTKLAARVPKRIGTSDPAVEFDASDAVYKVTLDNVTAYADDLSDPYSSNQFRDIDYLSYINDPGFTDKVAVRVSDDGEDFFKVKVSPFTNADDNPDNPDNRLDELTQQLGVEIDVDENYPVDFETFINRVTDVHVYFDESFIANISQVVTVTGGSTTVTVHNGDELSVGMEVSGTNVPSETTTTIESIEGNVIKISQPMGGDGSVMSFIDRAKELVGVPEIFPIMGRDPARGRAVSSNGEITSVEVTYPGSGYTQSPVVTISGSNNQGLFNPATATAVVEGGVYEMRITNAGFNYDPIEVPGLQANKQLVTLKTFGETPNQGEENPIIVFGNLNSALQGGDIVDPGDGFQVVGTDIQIGSPIYQVEADTIEEDIVEPNYDPIIDDDGVIQGFEANLSVKSVTVSDGGSGYEPDEQIDVTFGPPDQNGETAEGYAESNAAGQIVSIAITNPGSGYSVPPTVTIADPTVNISQTVTVTGGSTTVTVTDADELSVGLEVSGPNVPPETTIVSIDVDTDEIVISQPVVGTGSVSQPMSFIDKAVAKVVRAGYGSGYSNAPKVVVEAPPAITVAQATAEIDASRGVVSRINVTEKGNRYAVPPKVVIRPPNPRGEGTAATAVAVLNANGSVAGINIVDEGSGYSAPPEVLVQPHFAFARSELLDIASSVSAGNYELYTTHSDWTDRERGQVLVRPQVTLGNQTGFSNTIFIEASSADLIFEGDLKSKQIMALMQSTEEKQMVAPFTVTTQSRATQQQSGTIFADTLSFTLGNNIPTPEVGSSITNTFNVQTAVDNLRVTAAESITDPRGAFPYAITVTENDDLIVDAVPRTGSTLSFNVADKLTVTSAIQTDGDVAIKANDFSQTSPVITELGQISVEANSINILNSLQVRSAPVDPRAVDISLTANNGSVNLEGLIESPNAIEISQNGPGGVGGDSRLTANRLRISAEGNIDVSTNVHSIVANSETGNIAISDADDVNFERLTAQGTVNLEALGVDKGRQGENPIALTARILESDAIIVSAPNGSIDLIVDSSNDIELGLSEPGNNAAVMEAAGSVRIASAAGSVDVFDGPVAGSSASQVRAATTGPLPDASTYRGNTPGAFPSTLSGEGRLPLIDGVSLNVGDRVLVKDQFDDLDSEKIDESRENGVFVVSRLGGGIDGYRDWLLTRPNEEDTRAEFQPGTFVRIGEGDTLAGSIFQGYYPSLSDVQVTRTENSQLVVAGGTGGLLNVDMNDTVSGEGVVPGARVTGVDFINGVISLGVGNAINVEPGDIDWGTQETRITINPTAVDIELLRDAIEAAGARNEKILISGPGITVGAEIDRGVLNPDLTYDLFISTEDIDDPAEIDSLTIGFASAASGRTVLNPAVRTFLIDGVINNGTETNEDTITLSSQFTNYGSLREGQTVFGDGVAPNTVITKILPGNRQVEVSPGGLPRKITVTDDIDKIEPKDSPSPYFGEGFDNYLQMPDSFNDFFNLSIGQRVEGTSTTTETGNVPASTDPNPSLITSVDTTNLVAGMTVSGTNILAGATIQSIDSTSQLTLSTPVTTGSGEQNAVLLFEGGLKDAVITGIDPVYRQIGLSAGSVIGRQPLTEIEFKSIETVNFGMINKLGSGTVLFSADAFGYAGTEFHTPRIASGLASIDLALNPEESNTVFVENLHTIGSADQITSGLAVSGVGLNDGYRIEDFNSKDLVLYSAEAKGVLSSNDLDNTIFRSVIEVDDGFDAFAVLEAGMKVFGTAVVSTTSIPADVVIGALDPVNRTVTLDSSVALDLQALESGYFVFGEVFKSKFLSSASTKSAFNIHAQSPSATTFIGSENPRQITNYEVVSDSGGTGPGSLHSLLEIAQSNVFTTEINTTKSNPVITFKQEVSNIQLEIPLPEITRRALTIEGQKRLDDGVFVERTDKVTIDGRFMSRDALGNAVLGDSVIDGLVMKGEDASGTIVRDIRIGGFDNAAAIRVDGASDVLLSDLEVGRTVVGTRSGAAYGLHVTGVSENTTFLNGEVVGGTKAAVRVDSGSIGTNIIGSNLGSQDIINEVGIEVAGRETNFGMLPVLPRVTSGVDLLQPKLYEASYKAGTNFIQLESVTFTEWENFSPGLAVVGEGLEPGSVVTSVDKINRQLIINKNVDSSVPIGGQVLVGHGATGTTMSRTLELNDSVPVDSLFLGQTVRILGSTAEDFSDPVTDIRTVASINRGNSEITLDRELSSSNSIRLIEFIAPKPNVIEFNTTGMVVGLFTTASPSSQSDEIRIDPNFSGWQSLSKAPVATANADSASAQSSIVLDDTTGVTAGLLVDGTGVPAGTTVLTNDSATGITLSAQVTLAQGAVLEFRPVVKVFGQNIPEDTFIAELKEQDNSIKLNQQVLPSFSNNEPIHFEGAGELAVNNSTIRNNIEDGVVIGGGENHSFGQVEKLEVYDYEEIYDIDDNVILPLEEHEQILELVSWRTVSNSTVGGQLSVSDSRIRKALTDIVTIAETIARTERLSDKLEVTNDVATVLKAAFDNRESERNEDPNKPRLAVVGRGIAADTEIINVEEIINDDTAVVSNIVTLSKKMTTTSPNEGIRFVDEVHEDLKDVRLYGAAQLGDNAVLERFDADGRRMTVSQVSSSQENIEFYFGLNKFVVVDKSDPAVMPGLFIEGERVVEASNANGSPDEYKFFATGVKHGNELTLIGQNFSELSTGMVVTGDSIPEGTVIESVDENTQTPKVTLSKKITNDISNKEVTFDDAKVLILNGFDGWEELASGMVVTGDSIPEGTVIENVDEVAKKVTLSNKLNNDLTDDKVRFESRVSEFTRIDTVRAASNVTGRNLPRSKATGFLALTTPEEEASTTLVMGRAELDEIRIIRRDLFSNSISSNGGFGVTVASVGSSGQVYGDILATWSLAGNYFDIDLNRRTGSLATSLNVSGAIPFATFAQLPINADPAKDTYFSEISKTDLYGNQYRLVNDEGGTPSTPDEGDPPEPEDGIWPGFPF